MLRSQNVAKVEHRDKDWKWHMPRKRGRQEPYHMGLGLSLDLGCYQCI